MVDNLSIYRVSHWGIRGLIAIPTGSKGGYRRCTVWESLMTKLARDCWHSVTIERLPDSVPIPAGHWSMTIFMISIVMISMFLPMYDIVRSCFFRLDFRNVFVSQKSSDILSLHVLLWCLLTNHGFVCAHELLQCSSRSGQQTYLLHHVYGSDEFYNAISDGNLWAYPYTPCREMDLIEYMNRYESVWKAFHVNMDLQNYGVQWTPCSPVHYDVLKTDAAVNQVTLASKCGNVEAENERNL